MQVMTRCSSNKYDEVKNVRSVALTMLMQIEDETIATGTNLNINNMSPENYRKLCKELGVKEITEKTPVIIDIVVANIKLDKENWEKSWGKSDKNLDKDQQSID